MHTKSHNVEIMMGNETDDIIKELFKSLLQKYQEGLKQSIKESKFAFDSIDLFHYHLPKINLKRSGSYVDSPKWPKNKKSNNKSKSNDDKCFQYALTVALNYQNIKEDLQRMSEIKHFIGQYNWKEVDFPSHQNDWKKYEQSNKSIALNVLFVLYNTEKITSMQVKI